MKIPELHQFLFLITRTIVHEYTISIAITKIRIRILEGKVIRLSTSNHRNILDCILAGQKVVLLEKFRKNISNEITLSPFRYI